MPALTKAECAVIGARVKEQRRVREQPLDFDDTLGEPPSEQMPALTKTECAEIEARVKEQREYWDRVHQTLRLDAQACARSMRFSLRLGDPAEPKQFEDIVSKALDDYRSGRALMDHLGADRLLDPATTGMLLGIRRGFIEETGATTLSEMVLIDMAVTAFANAMRVQSMVGNTSLIIEGEMFGQPTLRAKWKKEHGGRPEDIQGLAVEEHVALLRDRLLPLAAEFHGMAREAIESLRRLRRSPALAVERAAPINIVLVAP